MIAVPPNGLPINGPELTLSFSADDPGSGGFMILNQDIRLQGPSSHAQNLKKRPRKN